MAMGNRFTVTALARRAGVSSKAIRYWESLGLLPRAQRTHTGYRVFPPETDEYLRFIHKGKTIGLSLREMREVLRLARAGSCPCEEVVRWTEMRTRELENEIRVLSQTARRLRRTTRQWRRQCCAPGECGEICTLIEQLPEFAPTKGANRNEKVVDCCSDGGCRDGAHSAASARASGRNLLPEVPALPLPLRGKRRSKR